MQAIREAVERQALDVATRTLAKLKEMDPTLGNQLKPQFSSEPKWEGFKLTLVGDDDIPINKRGSGVRRLILLNFFRAEAERKAQSENRAGVIYAIEEPEVSQHPTSIQMLITALLDLSKLDNNQVLLTTHVPAVAGLVPLESIRLVSRNESGHPCIAYGAPGVYENVVSELGILPGLDERVQRESLQLLICVEGPNDVKFLKQMYQLLCTRHADLIDINNDPRVAVIPLMGSNLQDWVTQYYFRGKGIVEFHIYDRDEDNKYQCVCDEVQKRTDGSCAVLTTRPAIESYVHPAVINATFGITVSAADICRHGYDIPCVIDELLQRNKHNPVWDKIHASCPKKRKNNIKYYIHDQAVPQMTLEHLDEADPDHEILGWFNQVKTMVS
jgi:hypothetical protein